jgi:hypothetical protein
LLAGRGPPDAGPIAALMERPSSCRCGKRGAAGLRGLDRRPLGGPRAGQGVLGRDRDRAEQGRTGSVVIACALCGRGGADERTPGLRLSGQLIMFSCHQLLRCAARPRPLRAPWSFWRRRCVGCPVGSARRSCCGTTQTSLKPRSRRRWASAAARSRVTPRGAWPRCVRSWSNRTGPGSRDPRLCMRKPGQRVTGLRGRITAGAYLRRREAPRLSGGATRRPRSPYRLTGRPPLRPALLDQPVGFPGGSCTTSPARGLQGCTRPHTQMPRPGPRVKERKGMGHPRVLHAAF